MLRAVLYMCCAGSRHQWQQHHISCCVLCAVPRPVLCVTSVPGVAVRRRQLDTAGHLCATLWGRHCHGACCVLCPVLCCAVLRVLCQEGEACDDGNLAVGDGCSDKCMVEVCAARAACCGACCGVAL